MSKVNFESIYGAPDPRPYYQTLADYDYRIPVYSGHVFGRIADAVAEDKASPRIVDLCCSYGVNAAVLKHDLTFEEISGHYNDPSVADLSTEELLERDRKWYASHRTVSALRVAGVDVSESAVAYACGSDLLDAGFVEDLEAHEPSQLLQDEIARADLITISGGIGYVTAATLDRVFGHASPPRLAALCLRWIDFAPIVSVGAAHGLVTERLDGRTFPQRRFAGEGERRLVETELDQLGIDPSGREDEGEHHTDLYLLRPEAEVAACPLDALLDPTELDGDPGPGADPDEVSVSVFRRGDALP